MKRIILAALAALMLAGAVDAKILVIAANPTTMFMSIQTEYIQNEFSRWQKICGLEYDTYSLTYIKVKAGSALYTHHGVAGKDSLDIWDVASQGGYSCAIVLGLPNLGGLGGYFDTSAECLTYNMGTASSDFSQWVNRNSVHKFPIPIILPLDSYLVTSGGFATAYTGQVSQTTRSWAASHDRGLKDANGDSIYTGIAPTNLTETFVVGSDSLSWVHRLLWRADETTFNAQSAKPTYAWMTVGAGNHKVIWFPYAYMQAMAFMWPAIIGMFEKITPIDVPILAELFGSSAKTYWGESQDTVSLGANFRDIKNYAVANGMKIDLLGLTYSMKNETGADAHPVFQTTAYTYANAFPNNIRITANSYEGWATASAYDWLGSINATTYSGVNGMLARISSAQAGILANFPTVSTTRASIYGGYFVAASTYLKQDSILAALAASGVTDVYNMGNGSYGCSFPGSSLYHLVGAQRTFIGRGVGIKEMRFHPIGSSWRYILQQTNDAYGDTLRISYINSAQYNDNRADFMKNIVPVACGYWRTTAGQAVEAQGIRIDYTTGALATHGAGYQPGIHLNALTFTGGSETKYLTATSGAGVHAAVDSSQSLFLDVMKQINNQVKMANYIQSTYGTIGQPVFVYQWMEDCKYDRRGNRTYSNNVRHD